MGGKWTSTLNAALHLWTLHMKSFWLTQRNPSTNPINEFNYGFRSQILHHIWTNQITEFWPTFGSYVQVKNKQITHLAAFTDSLITSNFVKWDTKGHLEHLWVYQMRHERALSKVKQVHCIASNDQDLRSVMAFFFLYIIC